MSSIAKVSLFRCLRKYTLLTIAGYCPTQDLAPSLEAILPQATESKLGNGPCEFKYN